MTGTSVPARRRAFFGVLVLAALPAWAADSAPPKELTVFAAASLTDVLQEIGEAYRGKTGVAVRFSFAASSALAKQVETGAPADAFVSADLEWMDYLANHGNVDLKTRRNVAGNELVLIAPAGSGAKLAIARDFPLAAALGDGRLAAADPASVPAGRYAKAALTSLGVWTQVESRIAPTENVRAALALVSRGEAPLGIVYRTDGRVDPKVEVVGAFPAGSYPAIVYPAARLANGAVEAAAFVDFLGGPEARAIFARYGFTAPGK
jgi:molybdate transport system substrate-binding protein